MAWKCAKRIQGKLYIYKISTSNRRFIRHIKRLKKGADRFTDPLPCEIDNHEDTTCFGKNFRAISFTSEVCTVSPFLSEYDSLSDIPTCTAATAVDLDSGETIILEFGQDLWFGERMEHSLINPNQCRSFGVRVCGDPTEGNRKLGMELLGDYFVPFTMRGTTSNFQSCSPELSELDTCKTFQVSDAHTWNPTEDMFHILTVERGQVYASDLFDLCSYDLCLHDFDIIQGSPTHIIPQIRTSECHHGVDAELLSLKWGIGLEKTRNTLKSTTQLNVRSALLPLTRR